MTAPGRGGKQDLIAAARDAVDSEQQKKADRAAQEQATTAAAVARRRLVLGICGIGSLLLAATLIIRPMFLFGVKELPSDPPGVRAANQSGLLVVLGARLEAYERSHGALPETLADLGGSAPPDITYERIDATHFRLQTITEPRLSYSSGDDPGALLGDQMSKLRRGGQ